MGEQCTIVHFAGEPSTVRIETLKRTEDTFLDAKHTFGIVYIVCIIISILTYVVDLGLAIILLYLYIINGYGSYFAVTLTFVLVPALFMTAFSLRWYIVDHDVTHDESFAKVTTCQWIVRIFFLLMQISPLLRYFDTLYYGIRSIVARNVQNGEMHRWYYRQMIDEDTTSASLRLFHCFLHAGPQSVIQLIILLRHISLEQKTTEMRTELSLMQAWAVLAAVISIAWSLTSYHRSIRFAHDDKDKVSCEGIIVSFMWHFMSVTSRVLALSLLAVIYPSWMGIMCGLHWIVMSAWLAFEHLTSSCVNKCEELFLSVALGMAYVVAFISPREGPTRYVYLAYYLVCFMENTGALVVWCVTNNSLNNKGLYYGAPITQLVTFVLALTFLFIYYRYCHPSSPTHKGLFVSFPGKTGLSRSYNLRSHS